MKVLYIASGTGMAGGATKSFIAMICQARDHGIEIETVCPDEEGLTQWLRKEGFKTHVVHFRHVKLPPTHTFSDKIKWLPRLLHDYWINFRARSGVRRIAKAFAPDLIHENSSVINVGYHASKSLGIPDVVHIREYGDLDFDMTLPGRQDRVCSPNVFTISITKDIGRHLKQDGNPRAIQIYDGIVRNPEFRFNPDKKDWFLYAGRIESAKGIDDLLDAYSEYLRTVEDPLPLYVCGAPSEASFFERMKSYVADNGMEYHVKWMGERTDIADLMAEAAATIIPSKHEGLGRVMPEAMANGSLCVAKYTGGTKEQLDNGMNFTGNPIALAYSEKAQLIEILTQITERFRCKEAFSSGSDYLKMIDRSQAAVREFFSEERFGDKIYDFYSKVINESKKESL